MLHVCGSVVDLAIISFYSPYTAILGDFLHLVPTSTNSMDDGSRLRVHTDHGKLTATNACIFSPEANSDQAREGEKGKEVTSQF